MAVIKQHNFSLQGNSLQKKKKIVFVDTTHFVSFPIKFFYFFFFWFKCKINKIICDNDNADALRKEDFFFGA